MKANAVRSSSLPVQFLVLLLSRGIGSALQAILVVVFARLAGAEGMGLVAIAVGATSMSMAIAEFGMSPLLSKSRALGDNRLVVTILRFNLWTSVAFGVAGFLILVWYLGAHSRPIVIAALAFSVALEKNTDVSLNVPIADGRKWVSAASIILRRAANLGAFFVCHHLGIDVLSSYVYSLVFGSLAGQAHIQVYRRRNIQSSAPIRTADLIRRALPYSISNISGQARNLDSVLVGISASIATAGLYSAAMRLTNPLTLVASSLTSVVMPFAARNDKKYAIRLGSRLLFLAAAALLLVSPFVFFAEEIIVLLLGREYAPAAGAFAGALLAVPFLSLASPLGSILQSQGEQRYVAMNGLVFAFVMLAGITGGALLWGSMGAAVGLAISFALKCLSLSIKLLSMRGSAVSSVDSHNSIETRGAL